MNYSVIISEKAKMDIRDIYEYIAFSLYAPKAAANITGKIEKAILSLDLNPERYRLYDKEPWKARGLRLLPVENYIIFYIPDENAGTVTITRVMYGGRDIDNSL